MLVVNIAPEIAVRSLLPVCLMDITREKDRWIVRFMIMRDIIPICEQLGVSENLLKDSISKELKELLYKLSDVSADMFSSGRFDNTSCVFFDAEEGVKVDADKIWGRWKQISLGIS